MVKQFQEVEFEKLFRYIGYGTLEADYWFIGMEEAGGGVQNITTRLGFDQVEDCKEAHQKLGITKHHTGKRVIQRTWRGMCCIMLSVYGQEITTENIRHFQSEELGRKNGNTFLCELMPLPKPTINDWSYSDLFPQFNSADDYYSMIKPRRLKYLRSIIIENNPAYVICYGKKYWEDYRNLFPKLHFDRVGIFSVGRNDHTHVVLTDHFSARSMNGQFKKVANLISSL